MATLRKKDINFLILEENFKKKTVIVKNSNLYLIKTKKKKT